MYSCDAVDSHGSWPLHKSGFTYDNSRWFFTIFLEAELTDNLGSHFGLWIIELPAFCFSFLVKHIG